MGKRLGIVMSVLLALSICLPGGVYKALAAEPADSTPETSTLSAPQDLTIEQAGVVDTSAPSVDEVPATDESPNSNASDSFDEPAASDDSAIEESTPNPDADRSLDDAVSSENNAPVAAASVSADDADGSVPADSADDQIMLLSVDSSSLQQMINDASDGDIITITSDLALDSTVTVPAGKSITLTDDGTARTITSSAEPMFAIEGTLVISATSDENLVLQGTSTGAEKQGTVATVNGGKLELRAGTLHGGTPSAAYEGTVVVIGGTFDMQGGIISGQREGQTSQPTTSCVVIMNNDAGVGSTFNMNKGSITDNMVLDNGPAVLVLDSKVNLNNGIIDANSGGILARKSNISVSADWNCIISNNANHAIRLENSSSLVVEGNLEIDNNTAINGAGIFVGDSCSAAFVSTDNTSSISENHASENGGGIYIENGGSLNFSGELQVVSNIADKSGGGIFVDASASIVINYGYIDGNQAGEFGGGIYLAEGVTDARINNAVVNSNTAIYQGGGLWCGPSSSTTVYVNEGMAVYNNYIDKDAGVGADIVYYATSQMGASGVHLPKRQLGGSVISYYTDGAVKYIDSNSSDPFDKYQIDASVPRYDYDNPGAVVDVNGIVGSYALATFSNTNNPYYFSKTSINGNSAKFGGGIASFGSFTSGNDDAEWELTVTKVWDPLVDPASHISVPVFLGSYDYDLSDYVLLDANNNWTATFTGLPSPDPILDFTNGFRVLEGQFDQNGDVIYGVDFSKWSPSYGEMTIDYDAKRMNVVVTNAPPETVDVSVSIDWIGTEGSSVTVHLLADGVDTGKTLILDQASGWRGSFDGALKFASNGEPVSYSVSEDVPTDYSSSVTGDMTNGFTITNEETVSYTLDTTWFGKTGDPFTAHLLIGTEDTGKSLTLDEGNGWKGSFDGLKKFDDAGQEIDYNISVDGPDGFTTSVTSDSANPNNYVITNIENTSISVSNTWVGQTGYSVTVHLLADDQDTNEQLVLSDKNGWNGSFDGVPKYTDAGNDIIYAVSVDSPTGFITDIVGDMVSGFEITNTAMTTSVSVQMDWNGRPITSVLVHLYANGDTGKTVTLGENNGWKASFDNLLMFDKRGSKIRYSVRADRSVPFDQRITGDMDSGFTIRDYPKTRGISVETDWSAVNQYNIAITVHLLENGKDTGKTLTINKKSGLVSHFGPLQYYDNNGDEIEYGISVDAPLGFSTDIEKRGGDPDFYITVTKETISIPVSVEWSGRSGDPIQAYLLADGHFTTEIDLNESNGWKASIRVPKYADDGHEIVYSVFPPEKLVFNSEVKGDANNGFTIIYTAKTTSVSVDASWIGKTGNPLTVHLLVNNGSDYGQSLTLDESNGWKGTFNDLFVWDDEFWPSEIRYAISIDEPDGYKVSISGNQLTGYSITLTELTSISIEKQWSGKTGSAVRAHLLASQHADDGLFDAEFELSSDNGWKTSYDDLPKYYADGDPIEYRVAEDVPFGFTSEVTGDMTSGFTITNTAKTFSIPVTLTWEHRTGGPVTVHLLEDDKDTGKSITLDEANGWKGSFDDLYMVSDGGQKVTYKITEDVPEHFIGMIDGDMDSGFTITNSAETISIPVKMDWGPIIDSHDPVTVYLLEDNQETGKTITLSDENRWYGSFDGLLKYADDGHLIDYYVYEELLPDYRVYVTGDAAKGFVITNASNKTISVSFNTVWIGNPIYNFEVELIPDTEGGEEENYFIVALYEDEGWKATVTDLPQYAEDGHLINYTTHIVDWYFDEEQGGPLVGYSADISGNMMTGFTITVTQVAGTTPEVVTIPVTKVWTGEPSGPVTVHLLTDGAPEGQTLTLDEASGWKGSFTDLPKLAADGHQIVYNVSEDIPEGYTSSVEGDMNTGFTITNTLIPVPEAVNISVSNVWVGETGGPITVHLLADGKDSGNAITLDEASGWIGLFTDLPKLAADGHQIVYTVTEDVPEGYTSDITGDMESGFTVTNTAIPDTPSSSQGDNQSSSQDDNPDSSHNDNQGSSQEDIPGSSSLDAPSSSQGDNQDSSSHEATDSSQQDGPGSSPQTPPAGPSHGSLGTGTHHNNVSGNSQSNNVDSSKHNDADTVQEGSDNSSEQDASADSSRDRLHPIPRTEDHTSFPVVSLGVAAASLLAGVVLLMRRGGNTSER